MQMSRRCKKNSLGCSRWTSGLGVLEDLRFLLQFKPTAVKLHFGERSR